MESHRSAADRHGGGWYPVGGGKFKKAGKKVKEGIYEVRDAFTGKPYIGQSNDIDRRLAEHVRSGKITAQDAANAKRTPVDGGKTAREIREHQRIRQITGDVRAKDSPKVANKVDPIGPNRQHLLP